MKSGAPRPHLFASLVACIIACSALALGYTWCRKVEQRHIADLAADLSDPKLQGVAIQREAFAQPDLLVLYGSSELVIKMPGMAAEFFDDYPTGFRAFPVGKAGTSSLATLQKLAAVGEAVRGRKVALSLSPSFFFEEHIDGSWYGGNFSAMQASELLFSADLSFDLKRAIARRMLAYPETLSEHWLLETTLRRIARGTSLDHVLFYAALPLGRLQNLIARVQDHFESALHIASLPIDGAPARKSRPLNWDEHLRKAEAISRQLAAKAKAVPRLTQKPKGSLDADFLARLKKATEWTDFELLLRVMQELGAQPLILSMPVHGDYLETVGVSRKAREMYPTRLQQVTSKYHAPLVYFRSAENDPFFFADYFVPIDHLGAKGWMQYNKTLDDFFHNRRLMP